MCGGPDLWLRFPPTCSSRPAGHHIHSPLQRPARARGLFPEALPDMALDLEVYLPLSGPQILKFPENPSAPAPRLLRVTAALRTQIVVDDRQHFPALLCIYTAQGSKNTFLVTGLN